jgi:hypothetical protein
MKKVFLSLVIMGIISVASARESNLYTVFYNDVLDNFKFPLVGFVNVARGDHQSLQAGFVNVNTKNFNGLQAAFTNTAGENILGAQAGFVNTSGGIVYGAQSGFINTALYVHGAQAGFINTAVLGTRGVQSGFVNTALFLDGAQVGFVNTSASNTRGAQIGFVNTTAKALNGVQIGFINVVDTIESGVPIGFMSFVRRGGYRAVEYSFSNFSMNNYSLKFGIEKFYTSINLAQNPTKKFSDGAFAFGGGIGAIFYINENETFFFNPEIINMSVHTKGKSNRQYVSLIPLFGYEITRHFAVTAGLSADFQYCESYVGLQKPFFTIADYVFDSRNVISLGMRAGVRVRF